MRNRRQEGRDRVGDAPPRRVWRLPATALVGFTATLVFAVVENWSLPEFCWSTWLAGLLFCWLGVLCAMLQIVIRARRDKGAYEEKFAFLKHIPAGWFVAGIAGLCLVLGLASLYLYCLLFGFYGIFLSVFAEMEPVELFGRNGFINSDFFTPVLYLLLNFWPMALGTLIAKTGPALSGNPWKRFLPAEAEIIRLHLFVVFLPFLTLLAWFLFGDNYPVVTIAILAGFFYLFPARRQAPPPAAKPEV